MEAVGEEEEEEDDEQEQATATVPEEWREGWSELHKDLFRAVLLKNEAEAERLLRAAALRDLDLNLRRPRTSHLLARCPSRWPHGRGACWLLQRCGVALFGPLLVQGELLTLIIFDVGPAALEAVPQQDHWWRLVPRSRSLC